MFYAYLILATVNRFNILNARSVSAVKNGHSGLFTIHDLALLMRESVSNELRSFTAKAVKMGILKRVARGVYINPLFPPNSATAIYRTASLLRWRHTNYISLESQLSHIGVISQIPMSWLTVMTTGRKGEFKTNFGTIEFTHTSREPKGIASDVYYDPDIGMFRAVKDRAIRDLKRVGRNVNMIEDFGND